MSPSPKVHVLSDLHLMAPSEPFYQRILKWLETVPAPGDHLALAGDIFDVYVGDKTVFASQHSEFFTRVRGLLSRGVKVHHVEGNHDFWLEDAYRTMGCADARVHGDFIEIALSGRKLRVEHGDLADSTDRTYLLLRRFFRGSLGRLLVQLAPGAILDAVGNAWSNGSRDRQPELPDAWSAERRESLREMYFAYARTQLGATGASALVMGHCHDAHECAGYMNVGFPRKHGAWVRWTPETNLLERVGLD
jgi:UDP-2,3-diacylglucosamine hydrolase